MHHIIRQILPFLVCGVFVASLIGPMICAVLATTLRRLFARLPLQSA